MAISNEQLKVWAKPGALTSAEATHTSIKAALKAHGWPPGMSYKTYLQGSYGNHTNIRADSDVDLVVEAVGIFYSNLLLEQKQALRLPPPPFSFSDFKSQVTTALRSYYGVPLIDNTSSSKCLTVKPSNGRLSADVIPCAEYLRYDHLQVAAEGITFFTPEQIINYPTLHRLNGESKNVQTSGQFKSLVRIFKNARKKMGPKAGSYSSYFVECLIYNVPNVKFNGTLGEAYFNVIKYLVTTDMSLFTTQSGQEYLFGTSSTQWNLVGANAFLNELARIWNEG